MPRPIGGRFRHARAQGAPLPFGFAIALAPALVPAVAPAVAPAS